MNSQRWHEIDRIFQAVVEQPPELRASFLDETCSGDETLRSEVEALISSDEQNWSFIDSPALEVAAPILSQSRSALEIGQRVSYYEILDLIGSGGMGEVYLAEDTRLGRKVALKLLPADFTRDESRVRRFQQEARTASSLNHPNILTIHDVGVVDGRQFIATEFIAGETLRQRLNHSRLSLREALRIAAQAAEALAAAHAAGIVHRDIKPENIMLRPDGYVKVLDFGLAKLTEQHAPPDASPTDKTDSRPGMIMGTAKYMSPEQARGQEVDARCDIFSLGVIIYEMLEGRPPFEGQTNSDVIAAILKVEPAPLTQSGADVPAELQSIVSKALCKNRDERYLTINNMLADIESLRGELDLETKLLRSAHSAAEAAVATDPTAGGFQTTNEPSTSTGPTEAIYTASIQASIFGKIKRHRALLTIAAIVVLAAAGWWAREHYFKSGLGLPFQERDWVLITSFDNRTGDSLFDGTIEYAIERELSNSQFVNVAPPERIEDALRLMKKPPDTKVDVAIGKEVCLRDGGIRALLTGRTEKLGSTYVLSVNLVDPHSGRAVASDSEEAKGNEQVGPAVRQLANWVRKALGEKLATIRQSDEAMEKVTTPSLRALQLYTQGEALIRQPRGDAVAEQLFRQALVEDPEFASAHMMLAWSLKNQKKPEDEWTPPSDRALELAERVSERERYFIQGSYYSIRRQDDKAAPIYEALLQRYPDHYWGRNNLAVAYYQRLYRIRDALPHATYRAALRPNDFDIQLFATLIAAACHHPDEALRYAKRANDLITPEQTRRNPGGVTWIQYFLINEPYERGDLAATLTELDRLAQTIDARNGSERDAYCLRAAYGYLRFGKLQTAEELANKVIQTNSPLIRALIALTKDDKDKLKKASLEHLSSGAQGRFDALPILIRAGLFAEAQKLISTPALKGEGFVKAYQGEIALAQGRRAHAIPLLEQGIKSAQSSCLWECFYAGSESLGEAYEQQGDLPASLRALEEGCREVEAGNVAGTIARVFWLRIKSRLAQLYRKLGRVEDAQGVEAELLRLLAYADEDHPILRQLKHSR